MKNEVLLASLIRGNLIEKTSQPWTLSYEAGKINDDAAIKISIKEITEAEKQIADAIKKLPQGKIPLKVKIHCNENEYCYFTAPDFDGIEKIRNAEINEAWDTGSPLNLENGELNFTPRTADFGSSRCMVVKNRIALVTGGAQGFGKEIVCGLVSAGALVFIADLNMEGAVKLAENLNKEQGKITCFPMEVNVADEASVEKMTETIALKAGGLDLCISNAGVLRAAPILEQDIASFRFVTDINYTAFAIVTKHCGLLMRTQNLCAPSWMTDIIQINSKSGLEGSNKNGAYAGSKFGSIGLVQSFAKELVEYRIKVNAVCPGNFFDGPLWSDPEKGLFTQYLKAGKVPGAKSIDDVQTFYEAKVPMGRGCTGLDVIRAILYLIEQVYETGQALPVTGGQVMLS